HATGDVRTANLLLPPNTVTLGLVGGTVTETTVLPTGTVTLTNMGDFVEVTNIYIVQARDTNFTDRLLKDDAQAGGIDNHDGPGGSLIPQDFFVSFPGQIFVVQPCLQVTKTCANGIGETGLITFSGTVSNCGNTLLTNVVVSNFVNGAFVHLLGPTNMDTNTVIPFSGAYLPSDPCSPTP